MSYGLCVRERPASETRPDAHLLVRLREQVIELAVGGAELLPRGLHFIGRVVDLRLEAFEVVAHLVQFGHHPLEHALHRRAVLRVVVPRLQVEGGGGGDR